MNKKGAAMIWAVISMLIIVILAGGLLMIGQASAKRSLNLNTSRQAYVTARSAVNAILSKMDGYSDSNEDGSITYDTNLFPQNVGDSVSVSNFSFIDSMGDCQATISRTAEDEIKISATATVGKIEKTVCAYLKCDTTTQTIGGTVNVNAALPGLNTNSLNLNSLGTTVISGDLYIADITRAGANRSTIKVGGTLYTTINATGGSLKGVKVTYGSLVTSYTAPSLVGNITLPGTVTTLPTSGSISLPTTAAGQTASYTMAAGTTFPSTSTIAVSGYGTYYIKIPAGCTMNLNISRMSGTPTVYVFMDDSSGAGVSTLNLKYINPLVNLYVLGGTGSTVNISPNVYVYGAISADTVYTNGNFTLNYVASSLSDTTLTGGSATTIETQTWSFERYDDQ